MKASRLSIASFLLLFAVIGQLEAQPSPDSAYVESERMIQEFDTQNWAQITKDIDYSGRFEEDDYEQEDEGEGIGAPFDNSDSLRGGQLSSNAFWAGFFKILFLVIMVGLLVALAYYILGGNLSRPRNSKLPEVNTQITIEKIEDNIHQTDLERLISQAVAAHNYRLAVRLYYLAIIKELSTNKLIRWRKEKTNRDYLRELRQAPVYEAFQEATRIFERCWYGNRPLAAQDFDQLQPQLRQWVVAAQKAPSSSSPSTDG